MKQVHALAILGQPAFVEGLTVNCPNCNQVARVREDGSAQCSTSFKDFAPEANDGVFFAMRKNYDAANSIELHHRVVMVPTMLASAGIAAHA